MLVIKSKLWKTVNLTIDEMIKIPIYQARHSKYPRSYGLGRSQRMDRIGKGVENYV